MNKANIVSICLLLFLSCSSNTGKKFIGTWKGTDILPDSAHVTIVNRDGHLVVRFENMKGGKEMEFPATYDAKSEQLNFELPKIRSSTPSAKAFISNDTLYVNNGGHTIKMIK